ncbi:MAG: SpoIVB peptidase [Clostridia bacterium]|nr:SpoIVB peptidase [Clostridia bacterium]
MQNTNEFSFSSRRGKIVKAIIILATVCLFAFIFGQSITKNTVYDNTSSSIIKRNEQSITAKRKLTSATKYVVDSDNVYVRIGGKPIGIAINAGGLIVIGESEVPTSGGIVYPARNSGIEVGDVIISVNGKDVNSIYQLKTVLDGVADNAVAVTVQRDGAVFNTNILPAIDRLTGQKKLGLMLKEDVGGVGTLTFVTQDGRFGALGHYIADSESGLSFELTYGNIYKTSIDDVIKGERGKAGGLVGDVNRLSTPIGKINMNTNIGLFGEYTAEYDGELYRIAEKGEAKPGAAKVYTTIDGTEPKFYDIDIVKVVSQSDAEEKGMVIAVRDKELLEKTGGIVQGMSGSPIVQDGILIGAVTHVFVQDPTRGYAVHSRFMYDYATNSQSTAFSCEYCEELVA